MNAPSFLGAPLSVPKGASGDQAPTRAETDTDFMAKALPKVTEGSNAKMGVATLVAGAATVANTSVTATSRIFLTSQADGGAPGSLRVSARVAGTSFTITSSSGTDTSTIAYLIVEPNV
jgi:hypothetical protein